MKRVLGPSTLASARRAPAGGPVEELLEAARLAFLRRGLEARLRAGLEALDVPAQRRGRRDAQDIIETIGSPPVEDFRTAIMAVGAQQYLGVGPVGPDRPQQAAQEGANLLATRPAGRSIATFGIEFLKAAEAVAAIAHHGVAVAVLALVAFSRACPCKGARCVSSRE